MSLKKTIAAFDIDTFGWYDETPYELFRKDSKSNAAMNNIRNFSQELWGLYIKNKTDFVFGDEADLYQNSIDNTFTEFHRTCKDVKDPWCLEAIYNRYKSYALKGWQAGASREAHAFRISYEPRAHYAYPPYSPDTLKNYYTKWFEERNEESKKSEAQINEQVTLGNFLLQAAERPTVDTDDERDLQQYDNFTYTDAITAVGLEALETKGICLNVGPVGIDLYMDHHANTSNNVLNNPGFRNHEFVVSDCTVQLWYGMCQQQARAKILHKWPGWSDIFASQDETFAPETKAMAQYVKGPSPHNSELRRFCRGLSWNLRMPKDQHVNLVPSKQFQPAYDKAKELWPTIIAASFDGPSHFQAVTQLIRELSQLLSTKEKIREKKINTPNPVDTSGLDGEPVNKDKFLNNKETNRLTADGGNSIDVDPRDPSTQGARKEEEEHEITLFLAPTKWDQLDKTKTNCELDPVTSSSYNLLSEYELKSRVAQKFTRQKVEEVISGATWFVPLPPPSDHGQLQGQLDEGSLSNFAAFKDPHIFSTPPEQGRGHIAIGIIVDSSGSMSSRSNWEDDKHNYNCMQEVCSFLGGFRDAISRSPNITMEAFAYHSSWTAHALNNPNKETEDPDIKVRLMQTGKHNNDFINILPNERHCCVMRPLNTDNDLLFTSPTGGTPTASAIAAMESRLRVNHPDSARFILVLTDGEPDSKDAVRKVVNSLDTPVFCVGIDTNSDALKGQYNPGHYFLIESPEQVAQIACELVQGIGQALNNA